MISLITTNSNHMLSLQENINSILFQISLQVFQTLLHPQKTNNLLRIKSRINLPNRILDKTINFIHIINCSFCIFQFNTSYTISISDRLLCSWGRGFFRKTPSPTTIKKIFWQYHYTLLLPLKASVMPYLPNVHILLFLVVCAFCLLLR